MVDRFDVNRWFRWLCFSRAGDGSFWDERIDCCGLSREALSMMDFGGCGDGGCWVLK